MKNKIFVALAFASERHAGQTRPGGESQIEHILRVGLRAAQFVLNGEVSAEDAEDVVVIAILHDILEDTDTTDDELSDIFGGSVAVGVRAVSHEEEEEPDAVYLRRVAAGGPLAVIVKRADRLDNLNQLRYAEAVFRARKLTEIRAALPIWYEIDPVGAPLVEALLEEVEHESAAS